MKVIESPSAADASAIVMEGATSSSMIVPVAVSVAVTVAVVPDTARLTVNVSFDSTVESSVVATVKLCVSPAVPLNVSAVVFSV